MTKRNRQALHHEKQLELEYAKGFHDGYIDSCENWELVIKNTPGVGPILQKRMMETVKAMATQRALEKVRK